MLDETSEQERTNVYTTSSFLSKDSTFLDDEAEENDSEIEVKDNFSDSEEERMYMRSCGLQNFYDEEGKYSSDDEIEELSDESEDFRRRVRRKRNQFVFEEVDVEEDGESLGSDTGDNLEEEDNGSDLESFIADDHEPTIFEETDEEEITDLNSSLFYKKRKRNRVLRFDDSDDDEFEKTATVESSKGIGLSEIVHKSSDVLPDVTLNPPQNSPQNSPKTEHNKHSLFDSPKNTPDQPTIVLDSSLPSKSLANELSTDEDSSDEIVKRPKSKAMISTMIIDSDSDEASVTDIMSDETDRVETSLERTNQASVEQSGEQSVAQATEQSVEQFVQLDQSSKVSTFAADNESKISSDDESDLDSLNNKRLFFKSSKKMIISDDEEDESVECVFTEDEDNAENPKENSKENLKKKRADDDFELNEEDLDNTLMHQSETS